MPMNPLDFLADLLLRWRAKESTPILERAERLEREVAALTLHEAIHEASDLLDSGKFLRAVRRLPTMEEEILLESLPSNVALLLRNFATIEIIYGDQRLDREEIGPSELREGFLRIGRDMDFAEVAVRPGNEGIYLLASGEEPVLEAPSIHHWLVLHVRLTHDPA